MTNALAPIDTNPLAFKAQIIGPVLSLADRRAKFAVRTCQEVSEADFVRLSILGREKYEGFNVFVPDAESMEQVTIPEKPKAELTQGTKKKLTAGQKQRLKLEEIARERGAVTPELVEEFYQERMAMNYQKLQSELEDIRREKAFMGQGA